MNFLSFLQTLYNNVRPILDVLILAFLLYRAWELLVRTRAIQLIKGTGFLAALYGLAFVLKLSTLLWILNFLAPGLFIGMAIIFQQELRAIFLKLGQGDWFGPGLRSRTDQVELAVHAAELLSRQKRGALMVFPRRTSLKHILDTGTKINADIGSALIISIFAFDGPLHDGAIVIQNGKLLAAGCFLPLSDQQDIRKSFGTRHRAALGMSEESDAVVLIVSEETGALSLAWDSRLYYDLTPANLLTRLQTILERPKQDISLDSKDDIKESFLEI